MELDGQRINGCKLRKLVLLSAGILNNDMECAPRNYEMDDFDIDMILFENALSFEMKGNEKGL
ncbi:MAG: hypothetical protein HUJ51_02205 [Eggerthellaceae bacterium]|nr:hypothetical protein [Eggerthellaceae bacterium]